MSETLCWSVTSGGIISPRKTTASNVRRSLEAVFGKMPIQLDEHSVQQLQAMMAAADEKTPYEAMLELIDKYGVIRLESEY